MKQKNKEPKPILTPASTCHICRTYTWKHKVKEIHRKEHAIKHFPLNIIMAKLVYSNYNNTNNYSNTIY